MPAEMKDLESLPLVSTEFSKGRLSYSQVRAITRVAEPENQDGLIQVAQNSTAAQLERVCAGLRRTGILTDSGHEDSDQTQRRRDHRGVWSRTDEDGSVTFTVRLPPEEAALMEKALQRAMVKGSTLVADRRADAIIEIAESFLASGPQDRSGADRTNVVIHVDAAVLEGLVPDETASHEADHPDGADGSALPSSVRCHVEDGGRLDGATARRLACGATWTLVAEGSHGQTVAVSAPIRDIPAHVERAVRRRDRVCRVPGCERRRLDLHHIRYRSRLGSNHTANLIGLCSRHHQAIHDGRLTISHNDHDQVEFITSSGITLTEAAEGHVGVADHVGDHGCDPVAYGMSPGDRFDLTRIVSILADAVEFSHSAEPDTPPAECSDEHTTP